MNNGTNGSGPTGFHFGFAQRGDTVTIAKGRKAPIGTVGEVIWKGESNYGTRVGVKDATGTVHWTASSNVVVTSRPAPPPAFVGRFAKGDAVRRVSDGKKGKVFWTGPDFKNPGQGRFGVRWAGAKSGEFVAEVDITEWTTKAKPVAKAAPKVLSAEEQYEADYQAAGGGDEGHNEDAHDYIHDYIDVAPVDGGGSVAGCA